MSISNIFDIITGPMMNRSLPGLEGLTGQSEKTPGTSFAELLGMEDTAGQWADITGPVLSDSINSALLELQEHGDISDVKDLWEEMSDGKSLDDVLMKKPEYVYASISASIKFGASGEGLNPFGSSENEYDMIFGSASWRFQTLMSKVSPGSNTLSQSDRLDIMQMNMMYRFRQVMP